MHFCMFGMMVPSTGGDGGVGTGKDVVCKGWGLVIYFAFIHVYVKGFSLCYTLLS